MFSNLETLENRCTVLFISLLICRLSLIRLIFGDFDYQSLADSNKSLGPLFFLLFFFFVGVIVMVFTTLPSYKSLESLDCNFK